jgi:septal ring factor EnvC (AmiA/AmiB activator)
MKPIVPISIIVVLLVAPGDIAYSQTDKISDLETVIENRKKELEDIQTQIDDKQNKLASLESLEKNYNEQLYAIEEQLTLNNRLRTKLKKQIVDINSYAAELEVRLKINVEELERREEILLERLVWIYKRSRVSPLLSALSADDLLTGARRLYLFSLLNNYDRRMVEDIEELSSKIVAEQNDLKVKRSSLGPLQQKYEQQGVEIDNNRKKHKRLLKEVREERDTEVQAIHQLEGDQERLANILDVLLQNKASLDKEAAEAFLKLKGKLVWPVQGKILRQFGRIKDEKYNTAIINPGIDIKASSGDNVCAASSGNVAYISWLRGYGTFIILEHGGGYYSLYSHLDDICVETDQYVLAGEILGTVGETGSLSGPMLHFELRSGKEQLDPVPWLR